jgi:3-hydroxypropanoate dehydrogenase
MTELDQKALDLIFVKARTRNGWQDKPVPESLLRKIYNVAILGPTSANTLPMRITFVSSPGAKKRLHPALSAGNQSKVMQAPVTAIFAYDLQFYDHLPKTFPHAPDARSWFAGNDAVIQETAFRNGTLQAAYFMIAARAHGLDCGPMSGFDQSKVNAEFFPDGQWKSNFICSLGYGTEENLFPRSPRLSFEETCRIV